MHIVQWSNLAVIAYLKKVQKKPKNNHPTHLFSSADISIFSPANFATSRHADIESFGT